MTTLEKYPLRMRFLKIIAANLMARDMRCDSQDRNATAVTIIEAVDQVQITWTTTSGTDR